MRTGRRGSALSPIRATFSVILFWVGPHRLGIEARYLQEIRYDAGLSPEDMGFEAILSAHEMLSVGNPRGQRLLVLRPGRLALRVDNVDRMIEIGALSPLPRAFQGAERAWYLGLALDGESIFPLLNPQEIERKAAERSKNEEPPAFPECAPDMQEEAAPR